MTTNLVKFWPVISAKPTPEEIALHARLLFNAVNDHDQAITTLNSKIDEAAATIQTNTQTVIENTILSTQFPGLGTVNDQTGNTDYTIQNTDNGALLVVSSSSPVTVRLNPAVTNPYFFFITNFGAGLATLLPTSPVLINGSASYDVPQNFMSVVVYDGANWKSSVPVGVIGGGTTGFIPKWSGAEALNNSHLDDGVTTASTITSSEDVAVNGTSQQALTVKGVSGGVKLSMLSPVNLSSYGYSDLRMSLNNPSAPIPVKFIWSIGAEGTYNNAGTLSNSDFYIYNPISSQYNMMITQGGSLGLGPNVVVSAGAITTALLFISSANKIGILTTSPSEVLEVNGNAKAKSLFTTDVLGATALATDGTGKIIAGSGGGGGTVSGSGTTGYIPKWTSSTALGNSTIDEGVTAAGQVTTTDNFAVKKHVGFGPAANLNQFDIINAIETPAFDLNTAGIPFNAINVAVEIDNPTDTTVLSTGVVGYASIKAGNTKNYRDLSGGYFGAIHNGSGNFSLDFIGVGCEVGNAGGGTILYMTGMDPYLDNSVGTATHMTGYKTSMHNEDVTVNLRAMWPHFEFSNSGTITNKFGIDVCDLNGGLNTGTITNNYGINIQDQASGTNNWAIKTGVGIVEIGDNLIAKKHAALGPNASIDGVPGTTIFGSPTATKVIVDASETFTNPAGVNGLFVNQQFTPSGTVNNNIGNILSVMEVSGSNTVNGSMIGLFQTVDYAGTSTASQINSVFAGPSNSNTGTVSNLIGFQCYAGNYFSGDVGSFYGLQITYETDGGTTSNVDLVRLESISGAGAVTNACGIRIQSITGATNNWAIKTGAGLVSFGDRAESTVSFKAPDLLTTNVVSALTLATDGTGKIVAGAASTKTKVIGITMDGGSSPPGTGVKGFVDVPFNCTITGWTVIADQTGSASIDIWFIAGGGAPPTAPSIPTSGNKISASAPVALSSAQTAAGGATAISTWTTALTQWGTLAFNLSSVSGCNRITVQLTALLT